MNYFIDTEFIEDGVILDLVSIAIVAEDGRDMYALNAGARLMRASNWVIENVLVHLPGVSKTEEGGIQVDNKYPNPMHGWIPMHGIMLKILDFIGDDKDPKFWADWGAYDWVAFARCFGRLIDLPKGFPMHVNDFQMLLDIVGKPELPKELLYDAGDAHDALSDARILKKRVEYIASRFEITIDDHEKKSVFTAIL